MRIEFQYTFDEWLEWKRANLHLVHFVLLNIAERSLIPLFVLLALSLIVISLQFLNLATAITSYVPAWTPIPILIPIALAQIYLSLLPNVRRGLVEEEWHTQIADLRYKLEVTDNGFDSISEIATSSTAWDEITSVYQTKRLLVFCEGNDYVLLIPKRAFNSKADFDEFLELAHRKTVAERKGEAEPLSSS